MRPNLASKFPSNFNVPNFNGTFSQESFDFGGITEEALLDEIYKTDVNKSRGFDGLRSRLINDVHVNYAN